MSRNHLLPDAGPVLDLHQALYCASRDYRGGLTALAAIMATNYDTLQKKLSIANTTHHLTLPEFETLVGITDDPRIDEAYARARGKVLFDVTPVPGTRDALKALGEVLNAAGEFVESLNSGVADQRWDSHEVAELEHYGYEVISKVLGIVAGARQSAEENHG
jgi:hypothetical protein